MKRVPAYKSKYKVYGRLFVFAVFYKQHSKYAFARCVCKCSFFKSVSKIVIVRLDMLRNGITKSCGCLHKEKVIASNKARTTHNALSIGLQAEYGSWARAIQRCYNKNNKNYLSYGGRNIKMYALWRNSFEAFFKYMGRKPGPEYSLDRYPNNNGDYKPGNVRWATPDQQANNRRPSSEWKYKS